MTHRRSKQEKTIRKKTVFRGRLLTVEVQEIQMASGVRSTRDIVRHPGAVAVLAKLPDGRFVLVRQFRKPVERELVEVVAGTLKPGEKPAVCARREVEEETGYRVAKLVRLGSIVSAPGFTDEVLHVFFAMLNPKRGVGQQDEDENVDVVYLREAGLLKMLRTARLCDAKTLAALQLWKIKGR